MLARWAFVFFMSFRIEHIQASTARSLSSSLQRSFGTVPCDNLHGLHGDLINEGIFITAAAFGAFSLYGYHDSRSLDAI